MKPRRKRKAIPGAGKAGGRGGAEKRESAGKGAQSQLGRSASQKSKGGAERQDGRTTPFSNPGGDLHISENMWNS